MVHKGTGSSYRSVEWIRLWSNDLACFNLFCYILYSYLLMSWALWDCPLTWLSFSAVTVLVVTSQGADHSHSNVSQRAGTDPCTTSGSALFRCSDARRSSHTQRTGPSRFFCCCSIHLELSTCWHSTVRKHSHFQMPLENPSIQTHLVLLCCIKRLCIFGPKGAIQIRYYYYY